MDMVNQWFEDVLGLKREEYFFSHEYLFTITLLFERNSFQNENSQNVYNFHADELPKDDTFQDNFMRVSAAVLISNKKEYFFSSIIYQK